MELLHVRLRAAAPELPALADFYAGQLGLEQVERGDALVSIRIGETLLEFLPSHGRPFYHFALLAPGNRYSQLLDWIGSRVELLPDRESGEVTFDFVDWGAHACYFHDPAGNIVELIAHRDVGRSSARDAFRAAELLGLSELGLVGDTLALASRLGREFGLELWSGTVEEEGRLAFVGERARTLILCPPGRPWLPTGRRAEAHPVEVELSGAASGEVVLERYTVRVG